MVDISVIIVNWNQRDRLERCLLALRADLTGGSREVLVVDNGSTDSSDALVRQSFPEARLIALAANVGFGRANNVAARLADGESLLLLNSDAYVRPGAVGALQRCLAADPTVGIVGPQLRYPDGGLQPSGRRFPTLWRAIRAVSPVPQPDDSGRDYNQSVDVDEVSGATMLIRRAALTAGEPLFDPAFAFFGEDIDLCWRLRQRGWRTRYCPAAVVEHEWGASRARLTAPRTALLAHRAYYLLLKRHRPPIEAALFLALLAPITLLKCCRWIVDGRHPRPGDTVGATLALGWREWHRLWRIR